MGKKKDMEAKIAAAVAAALAANKTAEAVEVKETTSESLSVSSKSGAVA